MRERTQRLFISVTTVVASLVFPTACSAQQDSAKTISSSSAASPIPSSHSPYSKTASDSLAGQDSTSIRDLARDPQYSFLTFASGLSRPTQLVIRDEKTWSEFWKAISRSGSQGISPPKLHFEREQVLIIALGPRNAGHDIRITRVKTQGDTLYAQVLSRTGIFPACRTDEINSPLSVVIVPRTEGAVKFLEHRIDLGCH